MITKATEFFNATIISPLKNNATAVMFWLGLVCILVGALAGKAIDRWPFIPDGTGAAVLNIGTGILGAGVFAVIMKSAQFTELFQRHITDVFYNPEKFKTSAELQDKWKLITNAILKDVLLLPHDKVAESIQKQFFDKDIHFHFEDFEMKYEISVATDADSFTTNHILKATLLVSPNQDHPVLDQSMTVTVDGECELTHLNVNDAVQNTKDKLVKDPVVPSKYNFRLELEKFVKTRADGRKFVKLERTLKTTQKLSEEPYRFGAIGRYINGGVVKAKVTTKGYRIFFKKSGPKVDPVSDAENYRCWTLAQVDDLLLPGQVYILILVPENKLESVGHA